MSNFRRKKAPTSVAGVSASFTRPRPPWGLTGARGTRPRSSDGGVTRALPQGQAGSRASLSSSPEDRRPQTTPPPPPIPPDGNVSTSPATLSPPETESPLLPLKTDVHTPRASPQRSNVPSSFLLLVFSLPRGPNRDLFSAPSRETKGRRQTHSFLRSDVSRHIPF